MRAFSPKLEEGLSKEEETKMACAGAYREDVS
jgi:hypothetical protein